MMLLMAPTIVKPVRGIGGRTRPMFNLTISNVPGPDEARCSRGAPGGPIHLVSIVTMARR